MCSCVPLATGEKLNLLLSGEVARLSAESVLLRSQMEHYQRDMEALVETSTLGHANPRWVFWPLLWQGASVWMHQKARPHCMKSWGMSIVQDP